MSRARFLLLSLGLPLALLATASSVRAADGSVASALTDAMPGLHRPVPPAAKGYVKEQQFTSPLTHEGFAANILTGNPRAQSYDYDFCPHPPFNYLAYALVTDPATGWTAYADQFGRCPFTAAQLTTILGAPKFNRKSPAGLPWLEPYPWEQFENAALQAVAANQNKLDVGNLYMQAAWSVRLDVISGNNEFDDEVAALFKPLPKHPVKPGDVFTVYELQLASAWEQDRTAGVLKDVPPARFALALAWLYRSRGELAASERWLDEAAAADKQLARQGGLYSFLRSSIKLERVYLRAAQEQFSAGWDAGHIDSRKEGLTALALAEISRRLGDLPAARKWYGEAQRTAKGVVNTAKVTYLQKLAEGRGY